MAATGVPPLPCQDDSEAAEMQRYEWFLDFVNPRRDKSNPPTYASLLATVADNIRRITLPRVENHEKSFVAASSEIYANLPEVDGYQMAPNSLVDKAIHQVGDELYLSHHVRLFFEGFNKGSQVSVVYLDDVDARKNYIGSGPRGSLKPNGRLAKFKAGVAKIQADLDSMASGEEKKLDIHATWGGTVWREGLLFPRELADAIVGGTVIERDQDWFYRKN